MARLSETGGFDVRAFALWDVSVTENSCGGCAIEEVKELGFIFSCFKEAESCTTECNLKEEAESVSR